MRALSLLIHSMGNPHHGNKMVQCNANTYQPQRVIVNNRIPSMN